jgi:hypothetical protein
VEEPRVLTVVIPLSPHVFVDIQSLVGVAAQFNGSALHEIVEPTHFQLAVLVKPVLCIPVSELKLRSAPIAASVAGYTSSILLVNENYNTCLCTNNKPVSTICACVVN